MNDKKETEKTAVQETQTNDINPLFRSPLVPSTYRYPKTDENYSLGRYYIHQDKKYPVPNRCTEASPETPRQFFEKYYARTVGHLCEEVF